MPTRPTVVPRAERRRTAKRVAKVLEHPAAPVAPADGESTPDAPAPVEPTTEQRLYAALQQQANDIADLERRFGKVSRERDQLREIVSNQAQQIEAMRHAAARPDA